MKSQYCEKTGNFNRGRLTGEEGCSREALLPWEKGWDEGWAENIQTLALARIHRHLCSESRPNYRVSISSPGLGGTPQSGTGGLIAHPVTTSENTYGTLRLSRRQDWDWQTGRSASKRMEYHDTYPVVNTRSSHCCSPDSVMLPFCLNAHYHRSLPQQLEVVCFLFLQSESGEPATISDTAYF